MAFTEKIAKKLKKILAKAGLEEDKANGIVEEVEEALTEEDAPDSTNPEENPEEPSSEEVVVEEEKAPEDEGGDEVEEVVEEQPEELPPEEGAAPQDGSVESVVNDFVNQIQPEVPQEEVAPEVPQEVAQPTPPEANPEIQELISQLEEQKKANEGLTARVSSLEEALKAAGILEGSPSQAVGSETPTLPESINNQGNILDDVLKQLNNK